MFKKIKNKSLLFIIFLTIFLSLGTTVLALEVEGIGLTNDSSIGELVGYLFKIIISIGITLATVSFAIGAIGLISPNPEAHNDAKDRMKGALLGIFLLATSFVIINQINDKLTTLTLTALPDASGVFLTGGNSKPMGCPTSVLNTEEISGYTEIKYTCKNKDDPKILVWKFNNKNLEWGADDLSSVDVTTLACDGTTGVGSGSFRWAYETPGVYFFMDAGCSKYAINAYTTSVNSVGRPFA